ncbi:MAG TPA: mersacidin/lichenicidin family type 2 lantibiotic [Ktedonobacteraceae bacterium]
MEIDIVRAWKDASYRLSLNPEQLAQVPHSPVGDFELSLAELEAVNGGGRGGSLSVCQFTGDNATQCPTIANPHSLCKTATRGPHSLALGSGVLSDLSEFTRNLSLLCA